MADRPSELCILQVVYSVLIIFHKTDVVSVMDSPCSQLAVFINMLVGIKRCPCSAVTGQLVYKNPQSCYQHHGKRQT